MDFYPGGGGGQGGPMTDIRRGDRWPSNIPGGRYVVENLLGVPVFITCGFLNQHSLGAEIVRQQDISFRARTVNGAAVVVEQVSSVLMLPRMGIRRIQGDVERDVLNHEHLHIHVTSIRRGAAQTDVNAQIRYNQVQQTVARLGNLLLEEIPDGLVDAIEAFLGIWGNPDSVRTGELRERLSNLEDLLASTFDGYTVEDDIVQFLTGEQSPVYTPPPAQLGTPSPPPLPQAATVIPANVPAWLESDTHSSSGASNSSNSNGSRTPRPGRLYVRVVFSVDDNGNPIDIYPMFKHGTFRTTENTRSRRGYTDLPPRDSQNHRLVSRFCAVSGAFIDNIYNERIFSNRLVEAGFTIEQGIGGQSEWHRFNGETNQERYVELLNAIEVLENYSNENEVQFERRNILEQLELHFNEG
jgi:hypothetical protein